VLDHYENPRNVGRLDAKKQNVGTGLVGAPACGDVMKLQIEVGEDGKIIDAKFKTFGCGSAIASSSLATEWIKGKSLDEAGAIKNSEIANLFGVIDPRYIGTNRNGLPYASTYVINKKGEAISISANISRVNYTKKISNFTIFI
jgi:NifU-like protein involved in Fe-S cluster formation